MITLTEAQTRLRKLAAERPDHVYPASLPSGGGRCAYFKPDGSPSCIVGHALADELRAAGLDYEHPDNTLGIRYFRNLPLDTLAREYLAEVQVAQDRGTPWGEAVAAADELAAHEAL